MATTEDDYDWLPVKSGSIPPEPQLLRKHEEDEKYAPLEVHEVDRVEWPKVDVNKLFGSDQPIAVDYQPPSRKSSVGTAIPRKPVEDEDDNDGWSLLAATIPDPTASEMVSNDYAVNDELFLNASAASLPLDRLVWQQHTSSLFESRAWLPFVTELEQQLRTNLTPEKHLARAQHLLKASVHAEPLLPSNVDAVAALLVRKYLQENAMTRDSGISEADLLVLFQKLLTQRASRFDPLSLVLFVGDELSAAFIVWDPLEDDGHAATAAVNNAGAGGHRIFEALGVASSRLDASAQERGLRDDVGTGQRRVNLFIAATNDNVRVALATPNQPTANIGCSLAQAAFLFQIDRIAESGVYTHVITFAQQRAFRSLEQLGTRALWWRAQSGAPTRLPQWDIVLPIPFADLGFSQSQEVLIAALVQIRSHSTRSWVTSS